MKNIVSIFFVLTVCFSGLSQEKIFDCNLIDFEVGKRYFLFGNDVKLRESPTIKSSVKKVLPINSQVTIVEKTVNTFNYNGLDWFWYKVKIDDNYGYLIGGLIGINTIDFENTNYVFSIKRKNDTNYLLTRIVEKENTYKELVTKLINPLFSIKEETNKGLVAIKHMLIVSSHAESCGVVGSTFYIFNDKNNLYNAIESFYMSDGGIVWQEDNVVFPEDKDGKKNKVILISEVGNVDEENDNLTKVNIISKEFEWKGKLISFNDVSRD